MAASWSRRDMLRAVPCPAVSPRVAAAEPAPREIRRIAAHLRRIGPRRHIACACVRIAESLHGFVEERPVDA